MKPIIGILGEVDGNLVTAVRRNYISAIERAGGAPMLFPYVENNGILDEMIDLCDGIFFTGGKDIDPARYNEIKKETCDEIQQNRDDLEFRAFTKAFEAKKPIFAICRGAQLVNVALGGTLYQDIPSEINTELIHRQTVGEFEYSHDVNIVKDTPLYDLIGSERIKANSFHHQAIKTLGKNLAVMALADDGIIEAIYSTDSRYIRAYQWHPERLIETETTNMELFRDFVNACRLN